MKSHDDGHCNDMSDYDSTCEAILGGYTITRRRSLNINLYDKIIRSVIDAFLLDNMEVGDKWVKIPRSAFGELGDGWLQRFRELNNPSFEEEQEVSKRGRNPIKRLFRKITDSKVMDYFRETLSEVKAKCKKLYENITQFSVCFLKGIHQAFCPADDPYGKISHFHEMIRSDGWEIPSRKTLNNYYSWFVNWRPVLFNESAKEQKERFKHSLWKQLIKWIYEYLLQRAPEYAYQPIEG